MSEQKTVHLSFVQYAEEIRRARAEAWDEGYRSGHSNAMRRMSDEPNAPTTPNPYRADVLDAGDGDEEGL